MLKENDRAPDFTLDSPAGKVSLKTLVGPGRYVVLYFYPKDKTPGCTREGQAFSAAVKQFERAGAKVFGISKDTVTMHTSFADSCGITVPLLSDPDLSVHKAYGAYGEKTMYGKKVLGTIRSTFVVGPDGRLARVFSSVKVDGHAEAVLAAITKRDTSSTPTPKTAKKAATSAPSAKTAKKVAASAAKKKSAR